MNERVVLAYQAVIDEQAARIETLLAENDALADRAADMQTSLDLAIADLQALRAAARAIVTDCRVARGAYLGDACRWCDNTIDRDGHRPGCPAGVLLPLLEEG